MSSSWYSCCVHIPTDIPTASQQRVQQYYGTFMVQFRSAKHDRYAVSRNNEGNTVNLQAYPLRRLIMRLSACLRSILVFHIIAEVLKAYMLFDQLAELEHIIDG